MTSRTRLLAYIYIGMCGAFLAAGIVLLVGLMLTRDARSGPAIAMIGGFFATISVFYLLPGLLAGLGLLRGYRWARVAIIILSLLVIFLIPVGTALGAFGLYVLLGPDSKPPAEPSTSEQPSLSPLRAPSFSQEERKRSLGILIAAAGVGAGFVIMIGTGYRVTGTPASPISDFAYYASIAVLVLVIVVAVQSGWIHEAVGVPRPASAASRRARREFAEDRQRGEDERRQRLATLAADPVRRKYAERIERGEAWSDEQIEYDLRADRYATCEHLQTIERDMRATGIEVRLLLGSKISARCHVDRDSLRARYSLPPFADYLEPQPQGRQFEDPLPALIVCAKCTSAIDVVHRVDATPDTPLFPATIDAESVDMSEHSDLLTENFTLLRSRVLPLARLIDAPAQLLPTYQRSEGNGLAHIEITGETYHYVIAERGQEYERLSTTSVDDLLYRIFRDVAFSMSSKLARPHQKPGEDFRREMFKQQIGLLDRLNPAWATRCAAEHVEVLAKHPFVDKP